MENGGLYGTMLVLIIVFGGMYTYFPGAWPRFQQQILMPYTLWVVFLCACYFFLQQKRGVGILHNFQK